MRLPLTRADLRSRSDELAEGAVAAGGGIEAVIEATGLRSRENVLRGIEPAVLVRAFANDAAAAAAAAAQPERSRLRRLLPDAELVRRRAAGEPLRRLARDYGVAHTTLGRYFARPQVAGQLRALARPLPNLGAGQPGKPLALRTGARQTSASSKTTATTGSTQPAAASSPSSRRCEPSRPKADADRRCR